MLSSGVHRIYFPWILHLALLAVALTVVRVGLLLVRRCHRRLLDCRLFVPLQFPSAPLEWDTDCDAEYYRIREANLDKVALLIPTVGARGNLERTLKVRQDPLVTLCPTSTALMDLVDSLTSGLPYARRLLWRCSVRRKLWLCITDSMCRLPILVDVLGQ